MLAAAIGSLRGRAAHPGRVKVIVGADRDDCATVVRAQNLGAACVVFGERLGWLRLHVYYQQLSEAAGRGWLLVWNDDAVMITAGWDSVLDAQSDSVLVADLQSNHSPICCFPAVRREAVDALGRFCTANPHVDSFWEVVGKQSGTLVTVPIRVHHDQQPGPHQGNEHGFHDPGHEEEMAQCAELIRRRKGSCS